MSVVFLKKKFDLLVQFVSTLEHKFSMLALTETWLQDDTEQYYSLPEYNAVHVCRKNKKNGGTSIFMHTNYEFIEREDLCINFVSTNAEKIIVEIPNWSSFGVKL